MKGDQAALLDDLVRYGAQLFFPFLRALSVVIRLGFAPCGRTSLTSAGHHQSRSKVPLLTQRHFFVPLHPLQEQALDGLHQHKKSATKLVALCFGFVIRLGFEPKTHSLEGCCSIQLSYRTDPYFLSCQRG